MLVLAAWLTVIAVSRTLAPAWTDVTEDGEFAFLPQDAPSRAAEVQFRQVFNDALASNVVLVVRRETSGSQGLQKSDEAFISEVLVPELRKIADLRPNVDSRGTISGDHLVSRLQWSGTRPYGELFNSEDKRASLIVLQLRTEFLDRRNEPLITKVEALLERLQRLPFDDPHAVPLGLDVSLSGTATFGRDIKSASADSARATKTWTVIVVVALLILICRAPLLALIPLSSVVLATLTSLALLSIAAESGWITLFRGLDTYVMVLVYGAGVDYCLFLIDRYREELDHGATIEEAVSRTLERVGAAITASAGTVMCGIGMMVFAEFGKFRQAGIAITFGIGVCLLVSLTLTPALLRLFGRWAFWPNLALQQSSGLSGWRARSDFTTRLVQFNALQKVWTEIGRLLRAAPAGFLAGSILILAPFAAVGVCWFGHLSYGLLSELPESAASVYGARALTSHFPAGESGVLYVLIRDENIDFTARRSLKAQQIIGELTRNIVNQQEELGLHTVRSMSNPAGRQRQLDTASRVVARVRGRKAYTSARDPSATRLELVFNTDPFARESISEFRTLRDRFPEFLPDELKDADVKFLGVTANLSDLKEVNDRDQIRIELLVVVGVFVILVILLRRPGICAWLMASVILSYLATLGITFMFFQAVDPAEFSGLDWKVPLFLFTILIAVGEDYNIFLMTRIDEETEQHGPVHGITVALAKTGSIISSCGIIMAGTFASLLAGSFVGMVQLGFALAVGILLDTFVVRPIMVPSFLMLLAQGKLGALSRLVGSAPNTDQHTDRESTSQRG